MEKIKTKATKEVSDVWSLVTLLAEGKTYYEAGAEVGLSGAKRTVQHKVKMLVDGLIEEANKGELTEKEVSLLSLAREKIEKRLTYEDDKKDMRDIFEGKARMAMKAMTNKKLKESSAAQLATIAAIAVDKMRLLSNESTENLAIRGNIDLSQLTKEDLFKKLGQVREANQDENNPT